MLGDLLYSLFIRLDWILLALGGILLAMEIRFAGWSLLVLGGLILFFKALKNGLFRGGSGRTGGCGGCSGCSGCGGCGGCGGG